MVGILRFKAALSRTKVNAPREPNLDPARPAFRLTSILPARHRPCEHASLSMRLLSFHQPRFLLLVVALLRNAGACAATGTPATGQNIPVPGATEGATSGGKSIRVIAPAENGFFAKALDFDGILIKAPTNVVDAALFAARERLSMMLSNVPSVRANLRTAGAELHIIGRDQVTTDLPEWHQDKGKPLAEYHGLTRDERTRGMGGLLTSCGEENLLRLEKDRYRGRDICVHEFAHDILGYGVSPAVREKVRQQYRRSLEHGLWVGSYAASNYDEFFAELTMWYFGTHGDREMKGLKPAGGREGLKTYDLEAFTLLDNFYSGRMESPGSKTGSKP